MRHPTLSIALAFALALVASPLLAEPATDFTLKAADGSNYRLAEQRGLDVVTFRDWKKIEEAEAKAAREGAPREKFVDIESMIRASR